jgi:hypothetical protein
MADFGRVKISQLTYGRILRPHSMKFFTIVRLQILNVVLSSRSLSFLLLGVTRRACEERRCGKIGKILVFMSMRKSRIRMRRAPVLVARKRESESSNSDSSINSALRAVRLAD